MDRRTGTKRYVLLGPAGSLDMGMAVLDAGADAVFAGLKGFSRRGFEHELTVAEIRALCEHAHRSGKTVRLAVNCYPDGRQDGILLTDIEDCVQAGVDAVILNDPGLCLLLRRRYQRLGLHVSVGASVLNVPDALFWQDCGATGLVLLCNLTPEGIRPIATATDLDLEVLVHANRCFSYLGKCWISSYTSSRSVRDNDLQKVEGSPNRGGICYRVCRTQWTLRSISHGHQRASDLPNECRLLGEELVDFACAGVTCFKIQGREYSRQLVLQMIHLYREMLNNLGEDRPIGGPALTEEVEVITRMRDGERRRRTSALVELTGRSCP